MSDLDGLVVLVDRLGGQPVSVVQACTHVLLRLAAGEALSRHQIGLVLDDLASIAADDEVWDLLIGSGLAVRDGSTIRLSEALPSVDSEGVRAQLEPAGLAGLLAPAASTFGAEPVSTSVDLAATVERVRSWAAELLEVAALDGLPGMPVFWQRDTDRSVPLGRDIGSMATTDVISCYVEPVRYGWPATDSASSPTLRRSWEQIVGMGVDAPGEWYDGAIAFPAFDDDFVGSFLPDLAARGACPTTEAVANRVFGLVALTRALGDRFPDLAERSLTAVAAGVRCLTRWQDPRGAWAIHSYPPQTHSLLPLRDVSTQYAADALCEALSLGELPAADVEVARAALGRLAAFLADTANRSPEGASWKGDFVLADDAPRLRTTTLMGLVIGRIAAHGHDELLPIQADLVRFVSSRWQPQVDAVFTSEFRSPTWQGPALQPFAWDMVRDAFVVAAILDCDARQGGVAPEVHARVQRAVSGMLSAEYRGSWLDVPMAKEGKKRAFASNTLHSLRAVLAAAARDVRHLPAGLTTP